MVTGTIALCINELLTMGDIDALSPGRFAQKTIPPGMIRLGRFPQNIERDCSHNITGTVRSKFNLQGQFTIFDFKKKNKLLSFFLKK